MVLIFNIAAMGFTGGEEELEEDSQSATNPGEGKQDSKKPAWHHKSWWMGVSWNGDNESWLELNRGGVQPISLSRVVSKRLSGGRKSSEKFLLEKMFRMAVAIKSPRHLPVPPFC